MNTLEVKSRGFSLFKVGSSMKNIVKLLLPLIILQLSILVHLQLPNQHFINSTRYYSILLVGASILYGVLLISSYYFQSINNYLKEKAPHMSLTFVLLVLWELATLKYNVLPLPFFPSPVKVLEAIVKDSSVLGISVLYSLRLLLIGYFIGALLGLITGILMGWYQKFRYWINPFVRLIGPVPSTAWIPIALVVFPGSFSASVFLIALATWFPVTVMTWSGITNVNKSYFEVARTLGADERYLITKVAIPAALPLIFIGLFMGLGVSFVTLIVAEMLGVKAGLGWYIQWAQGWGEYYKVYAALMIMSIIFSIIIFLLFKARDKFLVWQKGLIKW